MTTHSDPCCCKYGCDCRIDSKGQCRVCQVKLAKKSLDLAVDECPHWDYENDADCDCLSEARANYLKAKDSI